MKKAISLLLTLVLCLSLCACAKPTESDPKVEKYEKYESLIEKIEAGDYAGAYIDFIGRFPPQEGSDSTEPSTPGLIINGVIGEIGVVGGETASYKTVEITMDNWQEYFEVVPSEKWETNGFGEATSLIFRQSLRLKDGYKDKIVSGPTTTNYGFSQIAVEFGYNVTHYSVSVDWTNQTYVQGAVHNENAYSGGAKTVIRTLSFNPVQTSWEFLRDEIATYSYDPAMAIWDSIEVLRIQGTLYLKDE